MYDKKSIRAALLSIVLTDDENRELDPDPETVMFPLLEMDDR